MQHLDRTPSHTAFELHDTSVEGDTAVHGGEEPECSFAPDVRGLNRRAIFQNRQQRKYGPLREISVLEETARVADHIAKLELDRFEMGVDPLAAAWLEGADQSIAPEVLIRLYFVHWSI